MIKWMKIQNAPKPEEIGHTATAQKLEVDGHTVINVDFWFAGMCEARYFADATDLSHRAYVGRKGMKRTEYVLHNVEKLVRGKTIEPGTHWWCRIEADKKYQSLISEAQKVEQERRRQKADKIYKNRCERIEAEMAEVPVLPEGLEAWIEQEIMPGHYIFAKENEYICTNCGRHEGQIKHGKKMKCPSCGKDVYTERLRHKKLQDENIVVVQEGEGKWYERQLEAVGIWNESGKEIKIYEFLRVVVPEGRTWGKMFYGERENADEFEQDWWDANRMGYRMRKSYLYPEGLERPLEQAGLKGRGLELLAEKKIRFDVNKFITRFGEIPWLEYMVKGGLIRIALESLDKSWNREIKSAKDVTGLDGNGVARIREIDGGFVAVEWLKHEKKTGKKIQKENLVYLQEKVIWPQNCKEILQTVGSVNRMTNYFRKQNLPGNRVIEFWQDYIAMAAEEGLDTSDDIVRFPKELKRRHDDLAQIRNERKDEELRKQQEKKYKKLDDRILIKLPEVRKYFFENTKFMIIPAGKCMELAEEGKILHHCVGASTRYMEKMASGESWILFMRKKENLEEPFYTIEIDMKTNRILQAYSKFDRKPEWEEVSKVLEEFRKGIAC